jgi:4,5-dihydroxyphthalate decarboxylase
VQPIPDNKALSQMIESGELDAMYTARAPSTFGNGTGKVRRLFENYGAVEREYYRKTKIFPIMHTVVIRRDVYKQNPWIAQSLHKAFVLSQREVYANLHETAGLKTMLPWVLDHVAETEAVMGKDFWPYCFQANEKTLSTFLRYSLRARLGETAAHTQRAIRRRNPRIIQNLNLFAELGTSPGIRQVSQKIWLFGIY